MTEAEMLLDSITRLNGTVSKRNSGRCRCWTEAWRLHHKCKELWTRTGSNWTDWLNGLDNMFPYYKYLNYFFYKVYQILVSMRDLLYALDLKVIIYLLDYKPHVCTSIWFQNLWVWVVFSFFFCSSYYDEVRWISENNIVIWKNW